MNPNLTRTPVVDSSTRSVPEHADCRTLRSRTALRFLGGIQRVNNLREPWVAITFDDGPGPFTAHILDALRDHKAHATFFMLGSRVRLRPDVVTRVVREGHEIGNHTDHHYLLPALGWRETWSELHACDCALMDAGAPRPALARPCYGLTSLPYATLSALRTQRRVLWSLDAKDWMRPPARDMADRLLADVTPGDILLLHDGSDRPESDPAADRASTAEAVPLLLKGLAQKGLRPVTLSTLLTAGTLVYTRFRHTHPAMSHPKDFYHTTRIREGI